MNGDTDKRFIWNAQDGSGEIEVRYNDLIEPNKAWIDPENRVARVGARVFCELFDEVMKDTN